LPFLSKLRIYNWKSQNNMVVDTAVGLPCSSSNSASEDFQSFHVPNCKMRLVWTISRVPFIPMFQYWLFYKLQCFLGS
jgi:hypothetical protein